MDPSSSCVLPAAEVDDKAVHILEHREFWTNCFAPLPISVALLSIPSRANKILFRACRFSSFGLEALSLHAQQSLSPSQSQPRQDNPHDSSSGAAWSSLAHRIPEGLIVWRRGKGLDPRRAHAAIKSRTASKANGNLHPKKLQHLPFLRSFWMDLEGVLKKVGKRLQTQLPQSTALVAAYSM
ncbi:unnamed protein product [Sphagnum jensenii]|uniref:Uncharacterized protein n=1 Tax=Sphagnum jensenii TaxID=128206 RepID=A0ABP1A2I5_9BRYO